MHSFVEDTLKDAEQFDASSLTSSDSSRKDRLKYWNNDLCRRRPHTFDIVVAVRPVPCSGQSHS